MMAPVIPGLTDHEMPGLFAAAAEAGALDAHYVALRLPWAVAPLFEAWLERHAPGHKEKVLGRVRDMRGGKLYDAKFGERMKGTGFFAEQLRALYEVSRRKAGLPRGEKYNLSTASFRVPTDQLELHSEPPGRRAANESSESKRIRNSDSTPVCGAEPFV